MNTKEKHREKLNNYQHVAFQFREGRQGYRVEILTIVIGCLRGGMKQVLEQVKKIMPDENTMKKTCNEMPKTVLIESEMIIRKTMSRIVQAEGLSYYS